MIRHWRTALLILLTLLGAVLLFSSFHSFTPSSATGTWVARASMPLPRGFEGAAVVNGKIYVIGGTDNWSAVFASVQIYDPATDTWSSGAPMPTARQRMAVVTAMNGKIYTIGGTPAWTDVINTVEEYDPTANTWQTRANVPLSATNFAAAAAPDGKIYVFGGYFGCCGNYSNSTYVYDPQLNSWSTGAAMPTARQGANAAVAPNGKIYVMGGHSNTPSSTRVEEYDPATNTWATRSPLPFGTNYAPVVVGDDGMLYVFSGAEGFTQQYDSATDTWNLLSNMPTPRDLLAAAAPGNGYIYTFGGRLPQSAFPYTWVSTNEAFAVGAGGTANFQVKKDFSDNNTASVTVSLSCTSGTVSPSSAGASEASPANFTVTAATGTPTCTATESPVPTNYTSIGTCSAALSLGQCTIANTLVTPPPLNTSTFVVMKDFSDNNTASVTVSLICGGGAIVVPPTASASEAIPASFLVQDYTGDLTCTATENPIPAGYSSTGNCSAPTSAAQCTITNTLSPLSGVGGTPMAVGGRVGLLAVSPTDADQQASDSGRTSALLLAAGGVAAAMAAFWHTRTRRRG